jgi:hypothetical protein
MEEREPNSWKEVEGPPFSNRVASLMTLPKDLMHHLVPAFLGRPSVASFMAVEEFLKFFSPP